MFRFTGEFTSVKPTSVFRARFRQNPIRQIAATEMAQCLQFQAATIVFGQVFKVFLSLYDVELDEAQIFRVEVFFRQLSKAFERSLLVKIFHDKISLIKAE